MNINLRTGDRITFVLKSELKIGRLSTFFKDGVVGIPDEAEVKTGYFQLAPLGQSGVHYTERSIHKIACARDVYIISRE